MPDHQYHIQEQLFTAKTLYRELHQRTTEQLKSSTSWVFNDLVQLAQGNPKVDAPQLMQHINQSIVLRRQYMQLLQKLAFANSPVQAAASSVAEISSRKSAEFELLFKRDKQFSGQVYVILKIPHSIEKHHNQGVRVNCCSDKLISSVHFPPIEDGKTQLLMEESDQKFINMFDAEFAIYLS
ncbi:hypothetical protein [Paraglaciecola arctica]|uniref:Uncharacterized protein n=1 Tax=Paraglaciecola arctica BSs20135 TaxID=493475 RepID=K6XKK3_9ALTE|nr:hypothetical protein [Paraglaciecola arctica]GAC21194.1 hypothetical protein GARC_4252 [Paraglaciecola arctica BSs20135]